MKPMIFATLAAAVALPTLVVPAEAQQRGPRERQELRECNRELRQANSRAQYRNELRECRRELNQAQRKDWRQYSRYDYNRPQPGNRAYYADQYYRDGNFYADRRITRNDRLYRGNDGRYYCRRNDGTTGLIIGGAVGALLGRELDRGASRTVGTILGAGGGALLGREVERGSLRCN
jgi:Glycine zipper 2TM domain